MALMKRLIIIFFMLTALTGCGFHPRSAADIPPQLKDIYLNTKNPYSAFTTELKNMLRSLDITLAKTRLDAPYTIKINNYKFLQSNPAITTTSLAVTFTYSITLQISIFNHTGKQILGPKSLGTSRSIVQSPSQVYTPGTSTLIRQELRRDIISQIYFVLASENTRHALNNPKKHKTKHHVH